MKESLKILAAGDLHSDSRLAERLAIKAEKNNVDYVILCGDITHNQGSTDNMLKPFVERNQKVFLIPGNHDNLATIDFLEKLYKVKSLHGYGIKLNEIGFFGCGGSDNVGPSTPLSPSEMMNLIEQGHEKVKSAQRKVMLSHMHPTGSLIEKFSNFVPPSDTVRKALDKFKPDMLLCCHVHEAEGIEEVVNGTRVINVGKEGKILEF